MGLILVSEKDLEKYKEGQNIGSGLEATCYLNGNEVIKIFHHPNESDVLFSDLTSELIAFPKDIFISNDSLIYAYTMSFFPGKKIKNGFPRSLELKNLKESYLKLRQEIEKFDYIYMNDLSLDNILFDLDSNKLSLIDTSLWSNRNASSFKNGQNLDKALVVSLCRGNLRWLDSYFSKSKELFQAYRAYKLGVSIPFLEFLEPVENEIITKFSKKVETIDDLSPKSV